jgi:hypothetical protein
MLRAGSPRRNGRRRRWPNDLPFARKENHLMKKPSPGAAPVPRNLDQIHLGYAEMRIAGLGINSPGSSELARVREARKEILSRISAADLAAYRKSKR